MYVQYMKNEIVASTQKWWNDVNYEMFQMKICKNTEHQNKQPTNVQKQTSKIIMTNSLMTAIMSTMQPKRVPFIFTKCTVLCTVISFHSLKEEMHVVSSQPPHGTWHFPLLCICLTIVIGFPLHTNHKNFVGTFWTWQLCVIYLSNKDKWICVSDVRRWNTVRIRACSFIFHYLK